MQPLYRQSATGHPQGYQSPARSYGASSPYAQDPLCAATAPNIEGPFYKAGAPLSGQLNREEKGRALVVRGVVRDAKCRPIAGATLDIWQANALGAYDNTGFELRGQVQTDAEGKYSFNTIHPGHYLNGAQYRPAHIHVKLSAAGKRLLTTQLYFPGDPYNEIDPFIDRSLIMSLDDSTYASEVARFDFALG
ncbi:MAG: dioxygenase [Polyangiaceae bacterium]